MRIILTIVLSLIAAPALSKPELKGTPQELQGFLRTSENIVTISGSAEEKSYSDMAIVSLIITSKDQMLSDAISRNGSLRDEISSSLVQAGIKQSAIKSSKFSSSPQYRWLGKKPSSFEVVNRMSITIQDESHLREIAAVADSLDNVMLSDTSFEHSKKDEFRELVRANALAKIIKQKEFYEQSLGVVLIPVGISDSNIRRRPTRGALAIDEILLKPGLSGRSAISERSEKYKKPVEPSFDEVKYSANLSVEFTIENRAHNK